MWVHRVKNSISYEIELFFRPGASHTSIGLTSSLISENGRIIDLCFIALITSSMFFAGMTKTLRFFRDVTGICGNNTLSMAVPRCPRRF
ncbi:uncharacterized protein PHALS_12720 [Plasmopara halstedii]|uniref:Uncharacterized protein n=1 Tax=Plasmopara halstedii TaxID=4781 RepID=A0A0P1AMY6_PLAHL|nr:uncharacterized protein PHALS_12720 [Plasmopara halstedii]CEG42444.1 hypothetical protein PHALS_12720 [Plasmopara halstedii]|eukprot:XP_024578813.1 hypothetical protein PHALS_12720 [Plasmopara halstedii]